MILTSVNQEVHGVAVIGIILTLFEAVITAEVTSVSEITVLPGIKPFRAVGFSYGIFYLV